MVHKIEPSSGAKKIAGDGIANEEAENSAPSSIGPAENKREFFSGTKLLSRRQKLILNFESLGSGISEREFIIRHQIEIILFCNSQLLPNPLSRRSFGSDSVVI